MRTDLSRKELLHLTTLCVSDPYFECELGSFIQKEGAPMGGPLSGFLADLVIENKIEKVIETHPKWGPLWDWIRKADDTFMEWGASIDELHEFHNFLNNIHPRIQWTMEIENDHKISFLDVLIFKNQQTIETSVYRKPSSSNRYIHYKSAHPMKDKMAAMRTLRSRAEEYCSTPQLLKQEINLLSQIFLGNGYPPHIVYSNFHKKTTPTNNTEPDPNNSEPDPMSKNFFAPYHPAAHRLFKTLKRKFAINTIHTSTPNLGNFLFKRRPPSHPLQKSRNCLCSSL
jgi:hypothetical protein